MGARTPVPSYNASAYRGDVVRALTFWPFLRHIAHILYMPQNSEILNIAEVAAMLRCSKAHVCKAIGGKVSGVTPLPAISMGRRKLVGRQSLDAWLARNDPAHVTIDPSHDGSAVDGCVANYRIGRFCSCRKGLFAVTCWRERGV